LRHLTVALLAAAAATACDGSKKKTDPPPAPTAPTASSASAGEPAGERTIDLLQAYDTCTPGHRGTVIDLGDPASLYRFGRLHKGDIETVEHQGATWARVRAKSFTVGVVIPEVEGEAATAVTARVRGGAAKSASVFVNGKPIGSWPITKGESKVVSAHAPVAALSSGPNEILVKLSAPAHTAPTEVLADVDWIHVGTSEPEATIAIPTRQDAVGAATVGGVARSAISLRGPGFLRCSLFAPAGARLRGYVGLAGDGDADLEIRLRRDRGAPVQLGAFHLTPRVAWRPIDLALPEAGLGAIELAVPRAAKGARVLVAEPKVASPAPKETAPTPAARGVVLVVMGSVASRSLAVHGGRFQLAELSNLAAKGVVFQRHRASSAYAASAMASMLTGLDAPGHALADRDAKLPAKVTTIAEAARQAGVLSALFTGNPTTSAAFGFDRGWTTFAPFAPDSAVGEPFDAAAKWIDEHKADRFLVVVHARGGHPPWDASAEEMKNLDPQGYTGGLDPRHAAELLGRAHKAPGSLRLGDADRARAWALYGLALEKTDAALARLTGFLKTIDRERDTAVIVTSDAAPDDQSHFPFGESETLDESSLGIPLVVRPPDKAAADFAGKRANVASTSPDLAATVLAALGLTPPAGLDGVDLWRRVGEAEDASPRPLLAYLGDRFSLRWGNLVLSGTNEHATKLCDVALEAACVSDVRSSYPLGFELLHRAAYERLVLREPRAAREPGTIDATAAAQLKAWGR
jgi:arylsulfatase A-like enzyme